MRISLGRPILCLLGIAAGLVALGALFWPQAGDPRLHWSVTVPTAVAVLVVAAVGRVPQALKRRRTDVVVAIMATVVAGVSATALRYRYGWDANAVMSMARDLAAGRSLDHGSYAYLSLYPNNLPLLAVDRAGVSISSWLGITDDVLLLCVSAVGFGVTVFAVHRLVRPVAGNGPAVMAQLAVIALVGISPWLSVPYTDAFVLPVATGAVAVACAALRLPAEQARRRRALAVAAVLLGVVACAIKPTAVVLLVAGTVTAALLVAGSDRPRVRRTLMAGAVSLLLGGASLVGSQLLNTAAVQAGGLDQSQLEPDVSPPALWWVANGMVEEVGADGTHTYGSYSLEMVDAIRGRGQSAANRYSREMITRLWNERGPAGTVAFYAKKAVWNWEDGMFSAWGEGHDRQPGQIIGTGPVTGAVKFANGPQGAGYPIRSALASGLWVALLFLLALGALRARPRQDVVLIALSVIGIGAFTLLVQGRARYLYAFAPLVCALAGCVHGSLPTWRRSLRQSRSAPALQSMAPVTTSSTAARAASLP